MNKEQQDMVDFVWLTNHMEGVWPKKMEKKIKHLTYTYLYNADKLTSEQFNDIDYIDYHIRNTADMAEYTIEEGLLVTTVREICYAHDHLLYECELSNDCLPGVHRGVDGSNVSIGGRLCPGPVLVVPMLEDYLQYKQTALERHIQFEKIHPFADGNGRVGRILWLNESSLDEVLSYIREPAKYYKLFEGA